LGVNRPLLGLKCEPVLPGLLYHWNIQSSNGDSVQFSVGNALEMQIHSVQPHNKKIVLRGRQGKPEAGMVLRSVVSWSVLPVSGTASRWSARFSCTSVKAYRTKLQLIPNGFQPNYSSDCSLHLISRVTVLSNGAHDMS
jgi:hypothetical protein